MLVTGIIAVDQHWGAIDPKQYRNELDKIFFPRIEHMKKLDFIMFGGDTFDMKEYLSSDTVKHVLNFIDDLITATEKLNTKIVFIEGTRTHDSLQLSTLSIIFNKILKCDRIKFISSVCEDTIGDMKILYLPEEYVVNQEEYYKEFFQKHYDMILGHGITDKIWYTARDKSIDLNHHTTAPIFKVDELCTVGNYVYFGHIHEHKTYGPDNRFTSVGPSTRWEYGKEWDCGYYIVEYDTQSCLMDNEFVTNEYASKLITKCMSVREGSTLDTVDATIDDILTLLPSVDGIRIIVTISSAIDNFEPIRDFIITKIGQYPSVKLVLKVVDEYCEEVDDTTSTDIELSGKVLESTKTPIETQIANFILYKRGENIPIDYIKDLLEIENED